MLLARGEPAYRRFAEALADARPGLLEDEGEPEPEPPAPAEADAYFTSHFGSIPPRQALLSERAPAVYEGYFRLHRRVLGAEPGRAKQAELLMLALNAAALQPGFTAIHIAGRPPRRSERGGARRGGAVRDPGGGHRGVAGGGSGAHRRALSHADERGGELGRRRRNAVLRGQRRHGAGERLDLGRPPRLEVDRE